MLAQRVACWPGNLSMNKPREGVLCAVATTLGRRTGGWYNFVPELGQIANSSPGRWTMIPVFSMFRVLLVISVYRLLSPSQYKANTRRPPRVGITLAQHLRRLANVIPTLGQCLGYKASTIVSVGHIIWLTISMTPPPPLLSVDSTTVKGPHVCTAYVYLRPEPAHSGYR